MEKNSFILYSDQKEIFESLSDEQAGKLIKGIFSYIETGQEPELDSILKIAFIPIRQNLVRNNDKWEDIKQKRSEAGRVGAEKRWNDNKKIAKIANANFAKNEMAKMAVNVNVNDNVNVNVNDNRNNKGESCVDGLYEVIDFYNNNIGLLTPYGVTLLESYVEDMGKDVVIYALKISVEADKRNIKYIKAILNNWSKKGIKTLVEAQKESTRKPSNTDGQEFNKSIVDDFDCLFDN